MKKTTLPQKRMTTTHFRNVCAALGYSAFAVLGSERSEPDQNAFPEVAEILKDLAHPASDDRETPANQNYDHLKKEHPAFRSATKNLPPDMAASLPWSCHHAGDVSKIESYDPTTGDWTTLLTVAAQGGFTAEAMANFISRAVNDYEKSQKIIRQLSAALEACLESRGRLDWSAEHDAQVALRRAQQKI